MTLIIGILCNDGAVLGADGAATFGPGMGETTIRQPVRNKLRIISSDAAAGMSGSVGMSQRFSAMIDSLRQQELVQQTPTGPRQVRLHQLRPEDAMGFLRQQLWQGLLQPELGIAQTMAQHVGNQAPVQAALTSSIACLPIGAELCLFQFDPQGMPDRATADLPFVAVGRGQRIADPFLAFLRRIYWPDRLPSLEEGVLATVWALTHAIETNAGGVGDPIQIIKVSREGNGWLAAEIEEASW
ncbi:MAG TPA: hypothetical protein VKE94_13025, partial [Gemmataceae bacterium]|nr:hypothetical protein [Gemmataceae bacterium]